MGLSVAGLRRTMEDGFLYFTKAWHIAGTCKFVGHVNDFENLIYYVMLCYSRHSVINSYIDIYMAAL